MDPDRGGYTVTMRESVGADETLARLDESAAFGRLHVGWGSFRNLDIVARRRSAWVLLFDINVHQFRVWDAVRAALEAEDVVDPAGFIERAVPLLPHKPRLRQFSESTGDWLTADTMRPGSWLFHEAPERFRHVQALFRDSRVATACMDVRGDGFAPLAENIVKANVQGHAHPDTLYVSNLPWMLAQRETFFGESETKAARHEDEESLTRVHANFSAIAGLFPHVVSASHLAESSRPDDLQWQTELLDAAAFLAPAYWAALAPVDGPFRQLH
jgi:hypothetical protein